MTFIALGALNPIRGRSGRDRPSPPEAGSFVSSAKRPTARKQLSLHILEQEGRVPPQPVHNPRLPSAIFCYRLLQHPPHIFQGGNRHGWLAPHVGWDRHPNEIRATHQTTAVDLPLLLTVASSAFTGGGVKPIMNNTVPMVKTMMMVVVVAILMVMLVAVVELW